MFALQQTGMGLPMPKFRTRLDDLQEKLYRVRHLTARNLTLENQLEKAICDLSKEARSTNTGAPESSTTKAAASKQLTLP